MSSVKNIASLFDRFDVDLANQIDKGLSQQQLKQLIIRDLLFLLNTSSHYYTLDEEEQAYHKSVLNFGIAPISGKRASEIDWELVEHNIKSAILTFEPRIIPKSLKVNCIYQNDGQIHYNQMTIEIIGLIHALPFPEKLVLHTSLDIETGYFQPIL